MPSLSIGFVFLAVGILQAVHIDPNHFAVTLSDPVSPERDAQIAWLRMGLLQFLIGSIAPRRSRLVALSGGLYAGAFLARPFVPAVLIPIAAAANALIVLVMLVEARSQPWFPKGRLAVLLLGMVVDVGLGLTEWDPSLLPEYFAPLDSVRMRMLRLARMAAIALPLLATLQEELMGSADQTPKWVRRGQTGIRVGAVGMPAMLVACALTWTNRKGGLMLLTISMMYGVWMAARAALIARRRLERASWLIIFGSMCVGFVLSAFSFGGPFPTPAWVGDYAQLPRALIRQAHTYCIVFGLIGILLARSPPRRRWVTQTFGTGAVLTIAVLLSASVTVLPGAWLLMMVGPLMVSLGLLARVADV